MTGINGTGAAQAVNDFLGLTDGIAGTEEASNRFLDTWIVTGEFLDLDTEVTLVQTVGGIEEFDASDGLVFAGGSGTEQTLSLPLLLAEGQYELTLTNPVGAVVAEVYVLRGDPGEPGASALTCDGVDCTLTEDLTVNGDITADGVTISQDLSVTGVASAAEIYVDDLTVSSTFELPPCPAGYDLSGGVCAKEVAVAVYDEMVAVGDFWIDRHLVSLHAQPDCSSPLAPNHADDLDNASFPDTGDFTQPVYACSVDAAIPTAYMTWFQAQQACALSGKTLCTNDQWQAAAAGTPEVDCHVNAGAPSNTGTHPDCESTWGAQDMVGNLWEWVADWQGHPGWNGPAMTFTSEYGDDLYAAGGPDADAMAAFGTSGSWRPMSPAMPGLGDSAAEADGPAAFGRGGGFTAGTEAGVFAMSLARGPSYNEAHVGARCCIQTTGRTGP